jgi:hypothetical protein
MLSRMGSLSMIARTVRIDSNRSEAMSVEAKTAVIEHLGRQHQAMLGTRGGKPRE